MKLSFELFGQTIDSFRYFNTTEIKLKFGYFIKVLILSDNLCIFIFLLKFSFYNLKLVSFNLDIFLHLLINLSNRICNLTAQKIFSLIQLLKSFFCLLTINHGLTVLILNIPIQLFIFLINKLKVLYLFLNWLTTNHYLSKKYFIIYLSSNLKLVTFLIKSKLTYLYLPS